MMYAILCPVGVDSEVISGQLIGGNYVRGASGTIYVAGFGPVTTPDSERHINISEKSLTPEMFSQFPNLGKSVAISGIDNPVEFMAAFGLVRCNEDGSDLGVAEK